MICIYCESTTAVRVCVKFNPNPALICSDCKIVYEKSCQKMCTTCNKLKDWKAFGTEAKGLFSLKSKCKQCISIHDYNRQSESTDSFFGRMLNSCKHNSKNKKRDLGEFTLTVEQLHSKWTKQNGKCAISGIQMMLGAHVHFKCSPERLSNDLSYTDGNVVLIIAELNVGQSNQFTRELLLDICKPDTEEHPLLSEIIALGADPKTISRSTNSVLVTKLDEKQETLYQCVTCQNFKQITEFNLKDKVTQRRNRICKGCEYADNKKRGTTIGGKLSIILSSARARTRKRNSNEGRCKTTFDITKVDLIALLQSQRGKCAYSGKNLTFNGELPFHISLERKDVNIGYTKDNIVFICEELNTFDQSALQGLHNQEKRGNSAWSLDKFVTFRNEVNLAKLTVE